MAIVVSSYLPVSSSQVVALRLLRLLRVLRLVRQLRGLQVVVLGLFKAIPSVGYISIVIFLQFYLWAAVGVTVFRDNDPDFFGSLHLALLSLWQAATGDDWTDHLYAAAFGCDAPQLATSYYGHYSERCVAPQALGILFPAIFFISFEVLAAMILINLFIGVVMLSMEDAKQALSSGEVLYVKLVRGIDLMPADSALEGGRSDPYCILQVRTLPPPPPRAGHAVA